MEGKDYMRASINRFRVFILPILLIQLILIGSVTPASAQLPPEIVADKHLIHAEQLHAAKDYAAALEVMQKIVALQEEHNLTVPDDFHFKYARVALSADSNRIALESVSKYLSATGKEGEFYQEALKLMLRAEGNEVISAEDFYNDVIKAQGTCDGLPDGSKCWLALTNHPKCYVWNDEFKVGETVIWNGKCSGHVPDGKGTLTWYSQRNRNGQNRKEKQKESTGHFQKGMRHGPWVEHSWDYVHTGAIWSSTVRDRNYVNGKLQGYSFSRTKLLFNPDRAPWEKLIYRMESYSDGELIAEIQGFDDGRERPLSRDWSVKDSGLDKNGNGQLIFRAEDGAEFGGPYVNWKKHGKWVERRWIYTKKHEEGEGSYVNGKADGRWIWRHTHQDVTVEGSYVDNKKHGKWVRRNSTGTVVIEGDYVDGKRNGHWIYRDSNGNVTRKGPYVDGKRHGKWSEPIGWNMSLYNHFDKRFDGKGSYADDRRRGEWVYHHPNGDILKVESHNKYGSPQDPWLWYDHDDKKCWALTYWDKERHRKKKKVNKKRCLE